MITNDLTQIGSAIRERDREQCMNCHRAGSEVTLDVHHIVPRGSSGSNKLSNLILLCRQCHDAIHNGGNAPRVEWGSTGDMTDHEFDIFRALWNSLDLVRYDDQEQCWYIPMADAQDLIELIEDTGKTTAETVEAIITIDT